MLAGEQQAGTEHGLGSTACSAKGAVYKESKFKTLLTTLEMFLLDIAMNELQETQGTMSRMPSEGASSEEERDCCQEHQAISSRTTIQHCVGRNLDIIYLFHVVHVVLIELQAVL